jgi:hypothetical protein
VIERATVDDDCALVLPVRPRSGIEITRVCAFEAGHIALAARRVHCVVATMTRLFAARRSPVKTIAAIIIAGALSTLPGAGRADPVKTDKEQQARPATATEQVVREHVAACDCRAAKTRTGADDRQQVDRSYDPWSDPSLGLQGY